MHTSRCRHITHSLNAKGKWKTAVNTEYYLTQPDIGDKLFRLAPDGREVVSSNRANTFVKHLNEQNQVDRIKVYNNLTRSLQEILHQEFDSQGRLIHSVSRGEYYTEETVIIYAEDFSISHCYRHYNELFKDDEYVVMLSDSDFCIENTYSYDTGKLINKQVISVNDDYILDIDYLPDGSIHEWRKERI